MIYDTRTTHAWCNLDRQHFEAARAFPDGLAGIGAGCLDAPATMPAGSVYDEGCSAVPWVVQSEVNRDDAPRRADEIAARAALARRLVLEMLTDERNGA